MRTARGVESGTRKSQGKASGTVAGAGHCLPGNIQDAAHKEEEMSQVRAKVFLRDGQVMKLVFDYGLDELFEWAQRHHDDIDEFHAKLVKASEIRQGKK